MVSGRDWGPGYTQTELDSAQEKFGLRFPSDLIDLLRDRRFPDGYDWTKDEEKIRERLQWPLRGLQADVELNALWWPEWGERPSTAAERATIIETVANGAPRLIPLLGHRFPPEEPFEAGNPILSVMHSDIIYYGSDLQNYIQNEFDRISVGRFELGVVKPIRFWELAVKRAWHPAFNLRQSLRISGSDLFGVQKF